MIMNNIESDTEEVFYGGKAYKKVDNGQNLKRGLGKQRQVPKNVPEKDLPLGTGIQVAPFQDMLHEKVKFA